MSELSNRLILTGAIQSGKSTAVREVLSRLGWDCPAGYQTGWVDRKNPSLGLQIRAWGGEPRIMARHLPEAVGTGRLPFEFDPIAFAETVIEGLKKKGPLVIDELGMLEQDVTELLPLFNLMLLRRDPVLFVIQERALPFWQMLLNVDGSFDVIHLTPENRDVLPEAISKQIRSAH